MSNDLGIDRSGNGNNWTVNNMAFADQVVDSPTNNFATLNPLSINGSPVFEDGNTVMTNSFSLKGSEATMAFPTTGKWYMEVLAISKTQGNWNYGSIGLKHAETSFATQGYNSDGDTGNNYIQANLYHSSNRGCSCSYIATSI
jgi:hypothetical protein